jgi:hypothetical protein
VCEGATRAYLTLAALEGLGLLQDLHCLWRSADRQLQVDLGGVAARHGVMVHNIRVRVEIMAPGKYNNVGESQSVLLMDDPIISTRTRTSSPHLCHGGGGCPGLAVLGAQVVLCHGGGVSSP